MPNFRVNLDTHVPSHGYVVISARTRNHAAEIVRDMIENVDLTARDDRILFDSGDDEDPTITSIEECGDAFGEPINDTHDDYEPGAQCVFGHLLHNGQCPVCEAGE